MFFFALSHGVGTGKLRTKNSNKESSDPRVQFITQLTETLPNVKFNLFGMKNVQPVWANNFLNEISKCKNLLWTLINLSFQILKSMGLGRMEMVFVLCIGVSHF